MTIGFFFLSSVDSNISQIIFFFLQTVFVWSFARFFFSQKFPRDILVSSMQCEDLLWSRQTRGGECLQEKEKRE